jgi:hypothetical protein
VQIREVAAAATGDQDLFADAIGPLQYSNASSASSGFDGAHQAGRARAENHNVERVLHLNRC